MSFQQICRTYKQNIQQTREQGDATAELSLHGHLKDFLEQTAEFLGYAITITHEPRQLEIGRPDFVVRDTLFPLGYIEAEAYGRNLDALRPGEACNSAEHQPWTLELGFETL